MVVGFEGFLRLRLCLPLRLEFEDNWVGEDRFSSLEELDSRLVSAESSLVRREGRLSSGIEGSLLGTLFEVDASCDVREALRALDEATGGADVALDFSWDLALNRLPTVLVGRTGLEGGFGIVGTLGARPKLSPGRTPAALELLV